MPKQVWKIDKFEGGINDKADPRDILDNELVQADGVEVNSIGRIVVGGGKTPVLKTSGSVPGGAASDVDIIHGYGLFKFGVDYGLGASFATTAAETKFLAHFDHNDNILRGLQTTAPALHENCGAWLPFSGAILSTGSASAVGYFADGALRLGDSNFSNDNPTNKWIGVVNKTLFGATTVWDNTSQNKVVSINKWITTGSTPEAPRNATVTTSFEFNHSSDPGDANRNKGTWHLVSPLWYFLVDGETGFDGSTGRDAANDYVTAQNGHMTQMHFHNATPGRGTMDGISGQDDDGNWADPGDVFPQWGNNTNQFLTFSPLTQAVPGDNMEGSQYPEGGFSWRLNNNDYYRHIDRTAFNQDDWVVIGAAFQVEGVNWTWRIPWQIRYDDNLVNSLWLYKHTDTTKKSLIRSYFEGAGTTHNAGHLFMSGEGSAQIGMYIYQPAAGNHMNIEFGQQLEWDTPNMSGNYGPNLPQNSDPTPYIYTLPSKFNQEGDISSAYGKPFPFDNNKSAYISIKNSIFRPSHWEGTDEEMIFNSFSVTFVFYENDRSGGWSAENGFATADQFIRRYKWTFSAADYYAPVAAGKHFIIECNPAESVLKLPGKVNAILWEFDLDIVTSSNSYYEMGFTISDLFVGNSGCAGNEFGFSSGAYNFGITNIISGDNESAIADKGAGLLEGSMYYDKYQMTAVVAMWSHREASSETDGSNESWVTNLGSWNADERITGQSLYIKKSNSDNWFRIAQLEFGTGALNKGGLDVPFGKFTMDTPWRNMNWSDNIPWLYDNYGSTSDLGFDIVEGGVNDAKSTGVFSNVLILKDASLIWDYSTINAFASTSLSISARFKTSVQMNRQIYLGNIFQDDFKYADRMIKSPINKFDIFPSKGREIDVIVKDGDHITAMEGFADRILQFKKNSINVINCTKDSEFLENTLQNVGVEGQWAVAKTDMGIVFANNRGCFLYDGEKFINLIENKIDDTIGGTWDIHYQSRSLVGYQQQGRKVLVTGGSVADRAVDVYVLSLQTGGWTKLVGAFTPGGTPDTYNQTNLITFFDGRVYWIDEDYKNAYVWKDKVTQPISVITKDIDFGHPGVKKKVNKVYVTYSGTPTNVVLTYGTDGSAADAYGFTGSFTGGVGVFVPDDTSESRNIYSIQLKFASSTNNVPINFEINDISIVYRMKNVK